VAGFIVSQRVEHQIPHATSCRALSVPAWFYEWCHGDPSPAHARRARLTVEIRRLFAKHRSRDGSPRIMADLRDEGWQVSVKLQRRRRSGRLAAAATGELPHPCGRGGGHVDHILDTGKRP
jgi:hypothetical protein